MPETGHRGHLSMRSAGFRFKREMASEVLSIIIQVIIAVASLFASMAIPGNYIDPRDICFGFQTCAIVSSGLPAICLS